MNKFKHIIVTADLRDQMTIESARQTLAQAVKLATPDRAKITLLNVIQADEQTRLEMLGENSSAAREEYLRLEQQLAGIIEPHAESIDVETLILFGKAWVCILEETIRSKPDLLMAGPAHRGPVAEALFGSTTLKLIRKCPCPVWVVKPREDKNKGIVLVAHDLTEVGTRALEFGLTLSQMGKWDLHILHCLEPEDYFGFMTSTPSETLEREKASRIERLEKELLELGRGESAEISVHLGSPQVEIYNYLQEHETDVLIMGTSGRTGVAALVVGNTAETLLPWIRCSLLALKPEAVIGQAS